MNSVHTHVERAAHDRSTEFRVSGVDAVRYKWSGVNPPESLELQVIRLTRLRSVAIRVAKDVGRLARDLSIGHPGQCLT